MKQYFLYITVLYISLYINIVSASDNNSKKTISQDRPTTLLGAMRYGTPSKDRLYDCSADKELLKKVMENPTQYPPTPLEMDADCQLCTTCCCSVAGMTLGMTVPCGLKACLLSSLCLMHSIETCKCINEHQKDIRNHDHPVYDHFPFSLCKDTNQKAISN